MCFGGGGSPATITMPDTRAYDRLAQAQMDAIRQTQDTGVSVKQSELNKVISDQQMALSELRDIKTQRANETSANAARLAALIGTPPPEKAAEAPVIGSGREGVARAKGKKSLRIDRAQRKNTAGIGLNITAS
jgi:hypothetical protein